MKPKIQKSVQKDWKKTTERGWKRNRGEIAFAIWISKQIWKKISSLSHYPYKHVKNARATSIKKQKKTTITMYNFASTTCGEL